MNGHFEVMGGKLAAVRTGRGRRVIINVPPREFNPLKFQWLGGRGWKIGWKILFSQCSGHP
jgi:hypothetical protein